MQLFYTPQAIKQLEKLPPTIARRIVNKMDWFMVQAKPLSFANKLSHTSEETWRFRIGDFRALCRIRDGMLQILAVLSIKHRREVYRNL